MMPKDLLIARFPVEKGQVIRTIISKHKHMFHSIKWEHEGPLHSGKLTAGLSRPDSDDEGSKIRFQYEADETKIEMEKEGASVELHLAEFAA